MKNKKKFFFFKLNKEIDELISSSSDDNNIFDKRKKSISFQIHSTKRTQTEKKYVRKYTKKKKVKIIIFVFFLLYGIESFGFYCIRR